MIRDYILEEQFLTLSWSIFIHYLDILINYGLEDNSPLPVHFCE
nr:MAG TPA: hypothetical protein [Bacteriophage sp.]